MRRLIALLASASPRLALAPSSPPSDRRACAVKGLWLLTDYPVADRAARARSPTIRFKLQNAGTGARVAGSCP